MSHSGVIVGICSTCTLGALHFLGFRNECEILSTSAIEIPKQTSYQQGQQVNAHPQKEYKSEAGDVKLCSPTASAVFISWNTISNKTCNFAK